MTDDMKSVFERSTDGLSVPPPSLEAVQRKGRRIRLTRTAVGVAAALSVAVGVALGIQAMEPESGGFTSRSMPQVEGSKISSRGSVAVSTSSSRPSSTARTTDPFNAGWRRHSDKEVTSRRSP
jgi:hypothetical protein